MSGLPLALFPQDIRLEVLDLAAGTTPLFPEEEQAIRTAVAGRRAQFAAGRTCARHALLALGAPVAAIRVGPRREPLWPAGVVGSISHAGHRAAAAVGWSAHYRGLGLDIEDVGPMEVDAIALVASAAEVRAAARRIPGDFAGRLVFSAKESVFKCLFPLLGRFIAFDEVVLHLEDDGEGFRIDMPGAADRQDLAAMLRGRWRVEGELIATGAWIRCAG